MNVEHLVTMANEIAAFFDAEADKNQAAAHMTQHLRRYWEPRMRREIVAYAASSGTGLTELARRAIDSLR